MDYPHIKMLLLFMLVVSATHVNPLELHNWNKTSHESLRLIRSAPSKRSLDQTRASPVANCNEPTCVSKEQLCNETRQGCEMCHYGHDECTANWDCLQFCSEKKAKEICGGLEGSTETTGFPWWSYLIIVIFAISVAINIYFVILKLSNRKCHTPKKRRAFDNEESGKDERLEMLSNSQENNPKTSQPTLPKEPSAPPEEGPEPIIHLDEVETNRNLDGVESETEQTLDDSDSATSDADRRHDKKPDDQIRTDPIEIGKTVPIKNDKLRKMANKN